MHHIYITLVNFHLNMHGGCQENWSPESSTAFSTLLSLILMSLNNSFMTHNYHSHMHIFWHLYNRFLHADSINKSIPIFHSQPFFPLSSHLISIPLPLFNLQSLSSPMEVIPPDFQLSYLYSTISLVNLITIHCGANVGAV
jgi:hypothetical protein